jgi:hypothetical protein
MRCLFSATVLLLAILPVRAADQAKPNTLTPQEITAGWLLLFDGETTFGWTPKGEVRIADGVLTLGDGKKSGSITSTTEFGSFELHFEYRVEGKAGLYAGRVSWRSFGDKGASTDTSTSANLLPLPEADQGSDKWGKGVVKVGPQRTDYDVGYPGQTDPTLSAKREGLLVGSQTYRPVFTFSSPAGAKVMLRNIKVQPKDLRPIFNGKDLTGWKEYPGQKSKFTATKEGWLNIKDGKGDLQSEGQWGDFVLQIDCISNGDRLNSGVFFRCRPNEYQNGYEAQIHNGFNPEPKEYTLEEYDPVTHKLTGKKKVKYHAVDYGTGAIYRRQPARRQVAKDREWFTMTVIAHGNHFAVWVNGIEVTDWTDNRPLSDNARNGCRLEKGPISLQGHDPTTDLSFRNIRIAELPAIDKKQ